MMDLELFVFLTDETLFEETHAGRGRIMEFGGIYYAEAKEGETWRLVQFSIFPQVVRMALDHYLADENFGSEESRRGELAGQPRASFPYNSQIDESIQLLSPYWAINN
jgi:hypothetical protein